MSIPVIAKETTIRALQPQEFSLLQEMYNTYSPVEAAMGLPPAEPERRAHWLQSLSSGLNLVAVVDDRVVGHVALMPGEHNAEMAVFVHQDFRRRGIATALTNAAVEKCRDRGLQNLWVLITSDNNAARRGLLNYGFRTAWESMGEVRMEFPL